MAKIADSPGLELLALAALNLAPLETIAGRGGFELALAVSLKPLSRGQDPDSPGWDLLALAVLNLALAAIRGFELVVDVLEPVTDPYRTHPSRGKERRLAGFGTVVLGSFELGA